MKLVVGLGNPGRKYEGTRHNVGFEVLELLANRNGADSSKSKFNGQLAEVRCGTEKLVLLWPQTFMNNSGNSVRAAFDFFKLALEDVLIICDDFNLPLGKIRFRGKGTAGGQNGLADVIRKLSSEEVPRLRFGIGAPREGADIPAYVLSSFSKRDRPEVDLCVHRSADAVEAWAQQGLTTAMNQYNG